MGIKIIANKLLKSMDQWGNNCKIDEKALDKRWGGCKIIFISVFIADFEDKI